MLGNPSQSGGVLRGPEAVYFAAIHHGLEGGTLVVVLCCIFVICSGVAAYAVCPTIYECVVSVFWCVYDVRESISQRIILYPLYFLVLEKKIFLAFFSFFKFTITMFSSHISNLYI